MTTLVGIRADYGKPGVVLASDLSATHEAWHNKGDYAVRRQTKTDAQKIHISDDGFFALGMAGVYDHEYVDFLCKILANGGKVREAIAKGFFPELERLNLSRFGGRTPESYFNSLLVTTRFDNQPRLYTCWPLGRVEEREGTAIGSGSDFALEYLRSSEKMIPYRVSLDEIFDLAVGSLDQASRDIYTGGLDLVVNTGKKIIPFGEKIKQDIARAKARSLREIKDGFRGN